MDKELDKYHKSAVTNGKTYWLGDVDARGSVARRQRDLYHALLEQLGGDDLLSPVEVQGIRRLAGIYTRLEIAEGDIAAGRGIDDEKYVALIRQSNKLRNQLGLGSDPEVVKMRELAW